MKWWDSGKGTQEGEEGDGVQGDRGDKTEAKLGEAIKEALRWWGLPWVPCGR